MKRENFFNVELAIALSGGIRQNAEYAPKDFPWSLNQSILSHEHDYSLSFLLDLSFSQTQLFWSLKV